MFIFQVFFCNINIFHKGFPPFIFCSLVNYINSLYFAVDANYAQAQEGCVSFPLDVCYWSIHSCGERNAAWIPLNKVEV